MTLEERIQVITQLLPSTHQRLAVVALTVLSLAYIVNLIVKRKLREDQALPWLGFIVAGAALSLSNTLLIAACLILGIAQPGTMLLSMAVFALTIISLHLSGIISRQRREDAIIIAELSILKEEVKRLRASLGERPASGLSEPESVMRLP